MEYFTTLVIALTVFGFYLWAIPLAMTHDEARIKGKDKTEEALAQIAARLDRLNTTEAYENSIESPDGRIIRIRKITQYRSSSFH